MGAGAVGVTDIQIVDVDDLVADVEWFAPFLDETAGPGNGVWLGQIKQFHRGMPDVAEAQLPLLSTHMHMPSARAKKSRGSLANYRLDRPGDANFYAWFIARARAGLDEQTRAEAARIAVEALADTGVSPDWRADPVGWSDVLADRSRHKGVRAGSSALSEWLAAQLLSVIADTWGRMVSGAVPRFQQQLRAALTELGASATRLARAAEALGPALFEAAPGASPQLARSVQARENFYDGIAERFELLTSVEAGRRMGSQATRPGNAAIQAREAGRLVALQRGRNLMFPGFQFAPDRTVLPVIAELRAIAEENERSEVGLVEWLCAPNTQFDGRAPAEFLATDPEMVASVAANSFSVSW